jgi:hypothetical protein
MRMENLQNNKQLFENYPCLDLQSELGEYFDGTSLILSVESEGLQHCLKS